MWGRWCQKGLQLKVSNSLLCYFTPVPLVHYNGYLEYSDEPYDSSRLRNQPQRFHLGQGEVIAGWDLGVATMKKSEIARFLIKSEYAFGSMGCPPRIPPEAASEWSLRYVTDDDSLALF